MRNLRTIISFELREYFYSPIMWLVLIIFYVSSGYQFNEHLNFLLSDQELYGASGKLTYKIFSGSSGIFISVISSLFLYVPFITMGVMSKEFSRGTDKLLFSSPISVCDIVLGKYLALIIYGLVLLSSLVVIIAEAAWFIPHLDISQVLSGMFGIFLLFAVYVAIGLLMSSTTAYQLLAGLLSLATLFILNMVGTLGQYSNLLRNITYWLSLKGRTETFISGLISLSDIAYFFILIAVCLFFTSFRIEHLQHTSKPLKKILKYISVIVLASIFAFVSNVPFLNFSYDATFTKSNSLFKESEQVMNKLSDKIVITSYVNLADYYNWAGVPSSINEDRARFKKFMRYKSNIDMKYVYYVGEPFRNKDYSDPNRLPTQELARIFCENYHLNKDKLLTSKNICAEGKIDLVSEKNSFVRLVEYPSRKTSTILRIFEDMQTFPSESEITMAFKSLIEQKPMIFYPSDINKRGLTLSVEKDYGMLLNDKLQRYSAINQGFDLNFSAFDNLNKIDRDVILILSDFNNEVIDADSAKVLYSLKKYISEGGNLLLFADEKEDYLTDNLLSVIGLKKSVERLLFPQKNINTQLIPSRATNLFASMSPFTNQGDVMMFEGCCALDYSMDCNFEVTPILQTKINDVVAINEKLAVQNVPAINYLSRQPLYTTGVAMNRQINGKEQRIIVTSDADFVSNKILNTSYSGYNISNSAFILSALNWLSYGDAPMHFLGKMSIDNKIDISRSKYSKINLLTTYSIPFLLFIFGIIVFMRRMKQ